MATKSGTRHKLTKDHKDQVSHEIPPGFNATAHRFAKETRKNVEKSRTYMKVPETKEAPDQNIFHPTPRLQKVVPGNVVAKRKEIRDMPNFVPRQYSEFDGMGEQGLAGMTTPTDKKDQYYDNVNWYRKIYGKMPKLGVNERGEDLGRVKLDDEFFSYMERKRNKAMDLEYDMYKLQMVDLSTPSLRAYWQKRFPQLVERKLLYIRNKAQLLAKLQEVNARGVQDMEDMKFIYMYNLKVFDVSTPEDVALYIQNPVDSRMWSTAIDVQTGIYENTMMHENRDEDDDPMPDAAVDIAADHGEGFNWKNMSWGPSYGSGNPGNWFQAGPTPQ